MTDPGARFPTIFGRNLVGELCHIAHRPYLVWSPWRICTWEEVGAALRHMPAYVQQNGLWYTVASERPAAEAFLASARAAVADAFGAWTVTG